MDESTIYLEHYDRIKFNTITNMISSWITLAIIMCMKCNSVSQYAYLDTALHRNKHTCSSRKKCWFEHASGFWGFVMWRKDVIIRTGESARRYVTTNGRVTEGHRVVGDGVIQPLRG